MTLSQGTLAIDRLHLGGMDGSVLPTAALGGRVLEPALPVGYLVGALAARGGRFAIHDRRLFGVARCRARAIATKRDPFVRLASIGDTGEAVEDGVNPAVRCGGELKNCAASKVSSEHCRAINVTGVVRLQIGVGVFAFTLSKAKYYVRCCRGGCGHGQHYYK